MLYFQLGPLKFQTCVTFQSNHKIFFHEIHWKCTWTLNPNRPIVNATFYKPLCLKNMTPFRRTYYPAAVFYSISTQCGLFTSCDHIIVASGHGLLPDDTTDYLKQCWWLVAWRHNRLPETWYHNILTETVLTSRLLSISPSNSTTDTQATFCILTLRMVLWKLSYNHRTSPDGGFMTAWNVRRKSHVRKHLQDQYVASITSSTNRQHFTCTMCHRVASG